MPLKSLNIVFLLLIWISHHIYSQKIDNTAIFHDLPARSFVRIHYDNDFFSGTDYYYTQGYNIALVTPILSVNPLMRILPALKDGSQRYGLAFEHFGFTPTDITAENILPNDRPFAAVILLKSFIISIDTLHSARMSSSLSLGMIGPIAFGGPMQTTIHEWIGDRLPRGWHNEIQNDIAVNYELNYDKQLLNVHSCLIVAGNARLQAGTLNTKLQTGFTLMTGSMTNPLEGNFSTNKFQLYGYLQPLANFIAYDATLQGGLFNRSSSHTIDYASVNRIVWQMNYGLVLQYKAVHLSYSIATLSKEFKEGMPHRWGGLSLGFQY